jgi:glycosyltransferase involved in cell wall biosynthesis
MKRHKIVFQSNFSKLHTGFGKNLRTVLKYLYQTGKYDIVEYAAGMNYGSAELDKLPWKGYGTVPTDQNIIQSLSRDPLVARSVSYGSYFIDDIIKKEKPSVWFGIEDFWAFSGYWDKPWWNKINCVVHSTLDALPILEEAVDNADQVKNFYVWSEFAEKDLHRLGHKHVKTLHGVFDQSKFFAIPKEEKLELRKKFNLPKDSFIIMDVFRNQARKTVYTLLEGYANWKKQNPHIKNTYILLLTNINEGWNINKLAKEYGIPESEVLYCYVCKECGEFDITPFREKDSTCRFCGAKKSVNTISPSHGISEDQLRLCYGISDVMCHPFKNGGQELPIQEAKLCELITLVTNYSCGEDMCVPEAYSMPLEFVFTREFGTEFLNAQTLPESVAEQLNEVYNMSEDERREMGKKARQWVIDNYSIEKVGKQIEAMLDAMPFPDWDYDFTPKKNNTSYPMPEGIEDDKEFVSNLYQNILLRKERPNGEGFKNALKALADGNTRKEVYDEFIKIANIENRNSETVDLKSFFTDTGRKRGLFVMKESGGDLFILTSLFKSFKDQYPDYDLYVATQPKFASILDGNPHVFKVVKYLPQMEQELNMIGQGEHKGYVDVVFYPFIPTQRQYNYIGRDKIAFDINYQDKKKEEAINFFELENQK